MRTSTLRAVFSLALALAAVAFPASAGAAAPGALDAGFGTGGKAVLPALTLAGQNAATQPPVLLPDGRFLTSGTVSGQFLRARWTSSLALDTSFSGDGMATANFTGNDEGAGLAIQPDGKIVVVGDVANNLAIARFTSSGSLDTTFSGDGLDRQQDFGGSSRVLLQPNGRILALGFTDFSAVRYLTDGTLDTTFGGDGKVAAIVSTGVDTSCGMALQPDGKIVIVGSSSPGFTLARLNVNGSLDTSFDDDGKVTTDLGGHETGCGVALQSDGKIVYGGVTDVHPDHSGFDSDFALARYGADGQLDIPSTVARATTASSPVRARTRFGAAPAPTRSTRGPATTGSTSATASPTAGSPAAPGATRSWPI